MRRLLLVTVFAAAGVPAPAAEPDYVRDVKPILAARCTACHGAVRQKAGLRLDAGPLVRKGGKKGPVVVPGKPDESKLLAAVRGDGRSRMPPEDEGEALSAKEVAVLREWIAAGAKVPDEPTPADPRTHWAYRPPVRGTVPSTRYSVQNPIDAFLAAEREKLGVTTNPPADKPTLLRRVYLDLIGLPPTREELHAFLADTSSDAYEKVVDKLLASPHHGERWGRHWMDVWRYSDPFGLGEDYRYSQRHVWRWRDWIIEALNADKGYDRMVREMLAADEIAPTDRAALRATGYLARNWYKYNRSVWLQDTVEYTAAGFLGLTLRCARCHDHKYDPVSQEEYYRFRAVFEPHDVRIDPVPGEPDPKKDGVARAFDGRPADPTYLFVRGDERTPDKSRTLTPGVPAVLGGELAVKPVRFTRDDYAAALGPAIEDARRVARAELDEAEAGVKRAAFLVAAARKQADAVAAGAKPAVAQAEPFLHDTFAAKKADLWTVVSGRWAWENGKLVCKAPSAFATVTATKNHPADLMGRVRYRTTGGWIGSVGFSYDVTGTNYQAVYTNAGGGSAVRAFHQVNGQQTYPAEGVVPHPIKFGDEVTLDFAVRGDRLNTWVNRKLKNVYRLPVPRRAGTFALWTHDATVEFLEVRLAALPATAALAEKPGEDRPPPLGGGEVTAADAERAVKTAEEVAAAAGRGRDLARAALAAVEARAAAETEKYAAKPDPARVRALAAAAGKAERRHAALRAAEAVREAERVVGVQPAGKARAAAEEKLAAAKKAHAAADAAAGKDDPAYTPLVRLNPEASTGRRLALANWIADPKNPLTARVAVNHVWLRHFGKPLVATVANFGLSGAKPTHPELLDWLAVEFAESGWSMKKLHRLMVTSQTYRLSSANPHSAFRIPHSKDPENRTLWRMNPRRLEAEAVRDALLAVGGKLDTAMGGPILDVKLGDTSRRRSVYFRFNTEYKLPFLDPFDPASPTECYERRESVVPQQALALSNSPLALNQSRLLEKKLTAAVAEPGAFVAAAFEAVLGRPPTGEERKRCEAFLKDQAAVLKDPAKLTPFPPGPAASPPAADPARRAREDLLQVLFNHNDFVTVR